MVEVSDTNVNTQQATNSFARRRWTSRSQTRYSITSTRQNIPVLTHSRQTLTATVPRLDVPVCPAPYMAAARGHPPPAHPTARRTAQDLPMIRAPHTAHTPVTILRDHS